MNEYVIIKMNSMNVTNIIKLNIVHIFYKHQHYHNEYSYRHTIHGNIYLYSVYPSVIILIIYRTLAKESTTKQLTRTN